MHGPTCGLDLHPQKSRRHRIFSIVHATRPVKGPSAFIQVGPCARCGGRFNPCNSSCSSIRLHFVPTLATFVFTLSPKLFSLSLSLSFPPLSPFFQILSWIMVPRKKKEDQETVSKGVWKRYGSFLFGSETPTPIPIPLVCCFFCINPRCLPSPNSFSHKRHFFNHLILTFSQRTLLDAFIEQLWAKGTVSRDSRTRGCWPSVYSENYKPR